MCVERAASRGVWEEGVRGSRETQGRNEGAWKDELGTTKKSKYVTRNGTVPNGKAVVLN